jgi:hypothetical protein
MPTVSYRGANDLILRPFATRRNEIEQKVVRVSYLARYSPCASARLCDDRRIDLGDTRKEKRSTKVRVQRTSSYFDSIDRRPAPGTSRKNAECQLKGGTPGVPEGQEIFQSDPEPTSRPALVTTDSAPHSCHGGMTCSISSNQCPVFDLGSDEPLLIDTSSTSLLYRAVGYPMLGVDGYLTIRCVRCNGSVFRCAVDVPAYGAFSSL